MYDDPHVSAAVRLIIPRTLTWAEADPARHPFDPATVAGVIRGLPPAAHIPVRPAGPPADSAVIRWSNTAGAAWADEMSTALVGHYGRWASGWRWSTGESDWDGGVITSWCCPRDSMSDPLGAVAAGLIEWRDWLVDLAGRFHRFLPIPAGAPDDVVLDVWERAVAHLVTVVIDRTGAESGWYGHCEQVLGWFLAASGIPGERHEKLITDAIGGRFHSWVEPKRTVVTDVAERLAASVVRSSGA